MATASKARDHVPAGRDERQGVPDSLWIGLALFIAASLALTLFACLRAPAPAAAVDAAPLAPDARTCAAADVYTRATADDWLQRAAIAQASLNASRQTAPTCGDWARPLIEGHRDTLRWLAALDAVDAVASGSYILPPACARATVVAPSTQWPGAQCVIRDLVFAEVRL